MSAGTNAAGVPRVTRPGDPGTPMAHIPPDAKQLPWRATDEIEYGVKYAWTDSAGVSHRFRAHSAQKGRPADWNTSKGPIWREQVGMYWVTADGRKYHKNVCKESSPYYDVNGANDTHNPWPSHVPLPWRKDQ